MAKHVLTEEEIFYQAIEIPDEEARNRFLDESCQSDSTKRQRVGQLVDMHYSSGRILDETQAGSLDSSASAVVPEVGSSIGPYKLLQEIGEGGMGVVFMAEQTEPVRRKVAVKVIKVGMDTRRVVARFESERQAMALMDHPCITKVLDAGATDSGRPYFVMELVRGQSITQYCDEKRLSLRERLVIFTQVCNAVEHAHQKGIIHRDIKPTNIMVTNHDGTPLPKIIDFGIAKATEERLTDKTLFTNYGEMIGTPLYMSPEQAEMSEPDVDTRTDIYSLGVLLYELLTGTTPFHDLKKQSFQDIREAIRSRDPQPASTRINNLGETVNEISQNRRTDVRSLHRFVRGELDWILMKCLARDRKERYQSAGELAREIERYLNGEAVEAAAPTLAYRANKFVARHRAAVAIAAGFTLILASATVISTWMAVKANAMERLANSRLDEVIAERDRALAAEERIAELELKQRNRAAIHEGAAIHNANMVKRLFVNPTSDTPNLKSMVQVTPLNTYWNPQQRRLTTTRSGNVAQVEMSTGKGGDAYVFDSEFDSDLDDNNLEIVVVADDDQCQVDLLKSILNRQRHAFGPRHPVVARTLNHLGEVMCSQENWQESEACFREAFDILKGAAGENVQLSEIKLKLAEALKKKGDVRQAIEELTDYKEKLESMDIPKGFSHLLDKVKTEIKKIDQDDR